MVEADRAYQLDDLASQARACSAHFNSIRTFLPLIATDEVDPLKRAADAVSATNPARLVGRTTPVLTLARSTK